MVAGMERDMSLLTKRYNQIRRSAEKLIRQDTTMTPPIVTIFVTSRCNLRCQHCFNHQRQSTQEAYSELSLMLYEKISRSMGPIAKCFLSGGEPFVREDLHEIAAIFQKNNNVIVTSSSTNGQDTAAIISQTERILRNSKYQRFSLAFSLDGFKEEHDRIRGEGTYKRCLESWNACKELRKKYPNFDMYICSTINAINANILPRFIQWAIDQLEPSMVALLKTRQIPRGGEWLKNVSDEEYRKCKEIIERETLAGKMGNINDPQSYINASICDHVYRTAYAHDRSFQCFAGYQGCFIDGNGDIGVCEIMPPIGNLESEDYNVRTFWNNDYAVKMRNYAGRSACCAECTHETEGIIPSLFLGNNTFNLLFQ